MSTEYLSMIVDKEPPPAALTFSESTALRTATSTATHQKIYCQPFLSGYFFPCGKHGAMCPRSAIASMLFLFSLFQVLFVPFVFFVEDTASRAVASALLALVYASILLGNSVDPGVIPAGIISRPVPRPHPFVTESGETVELKVCQVCMIVRPPRSSHHGSACIQIVDHKCGTTGMEVADRNIRFFVLSLFQMFLFLWFVAIRSTVQLVSSGGVLGVLVFVAVLSTVAALALTVMLKMYLYDYVSKDLTQKDFNGNTKFVDVDGPHHQASCAVLERALCSWPLRIPSALAMMTDEEFEDACRT